MDAEQKPERTDRLSKVETAVAVLVKEVRINNGQLQRLVARHDTMLLGTTGRPGLATKLDRLEETEKRRTYHLRALWTALLGLAAKFGYDHFSK